MDDGKKFGDPKPRAAKSVRLRSHNTGMVTRLTRNEIQLLKALAAAGKHGRVLRPLTPSARSEIARLMKDQFIKRRWHTKVYMITERGREALEMTAGEG
jgi:DNA-binding PadR family transcriptional regulator